MYVCVWGGGSRSVERKARSNHFVSGPSSSDHFVPGCSGCFVSRITSYLVPPARITSHLVALVALYLVTPAWITSYLVALQANACNVLLCSDMNKNLEFPLTDDMMTLDRVVKSEMNELLGPFKTSPGLEIGRKLLEALLISIVLFNKR